MKNDEHPLIRALSRGKEDNSKLDFSNVPSRMLEIHHSEIPGLPEMRPGENVTIRVQGHISHPGQSSSVIQVHSIEPDSPAEDKQEFGTKDAIRVIPPNSPEPS